MQRFVIHKVGVGSLGRLVGTWFAIVGLIVGLLSAVVSTVSVFANNSYSIIAGIGIGALIVIGWVIVYPVVMYFIGWIQGAILALVFNFVVSGAGGLSIELEETALDGASKAKTTK